MDELQLNTAILPASLRGGLGENLRALAERTADRRSVAVDRDAAVKAAKDFEAILTTRLLEEMRSTVGESSLLESAGSKQMEDLFWMYLGQEVAKSGALGVWKQVYRQITGGAEPPQAGAARAASIYQAQGPELGCEP